MARKRNIIEIPEEKKALLCERSRGHYCIHCMYKLKKGRKLYCEQRPSNYSPVGYRVIRAHDDACGLYKQKM